MNICWESGVETSDAPEVSQQQKVILGVSQQKKSDTRSIKAAEKVIPGVSKRQKSDTRSRLQVDLRGVSGATLTRLRFVHTKGVSCKPF
jgi:hypothetical protein